MSRHEHDSAHGAAPHRHAQRGARAVCRTPPAYARAGCCLPQELQAGWCSPAAGSAAQPSDRCCASARHLAAWQHHTRPAGEHSAQRHSRRVVYDSSLVEFLLAEPRDALSACTMEGPPPRVATLSEQPFDVAFHPSRPLVAAGVITGALELFEYTPEAVGAVRSHEVHEQSCRAVRFHQSGAVLVSAGADCVLAFRSVESDKQLATITAAHDAAINRLEVVSDTVLASGACASDAYERRLAHTRRGG